MYFPSITCVHAYAYAYETHPLGAFFGPQLLVVLCVHSSPTGSLSTSSSCRFGSLFLPCLRLGLRCGLRHNFLSLCRRQELDTLGDLQAVLELLLFGTSAHPLLVETALSLLAEFIQPLHRPQRCANQLPVVSDRLVSALLQLKRGILRRYSSTYHRQHPRGSCSDAK